MPPQLNKNNFYLIVFGCLILFSGIFFLLWNEAEKETVVVEPVVLPPPPPNPFLDTVIGARSAIVFDANSGNIIYEKNSTTSRPLASVTKLMTAYTISEILPATSTITIIDQDLATEGESGLSTGETWTMKDLRDIMLVASSNDAAEAISRGGGEDFIDTMNAKSVERGWLSFSFKNPSGLDERDVEPTAYGNARDVAFLLKRILQEHADILEPTRDEFISRTPISGIGLQRTFKNTNVSLGDFPTVLGSKTGYTLSAGGNLALVYSVGLNRPIIIVVLGSEDQQKRFEDIKLLASTTEAYLKTH